MGPVWVRYGTGTGSVRVRYGAGTQNCGPVLEFGPVPQPLRTGSSRRPGSGPKRGLHAADPLKEPRPSRAALPGRGPSSPGSAPRSPAAFVSVPDAEADGAGVAPRAGRVLAPRGLHFPARPAAPRRAMQGGRAAKHAGRCSPQWGGGGSSRDGGSPPSGLTGVSRSRCGLLAAVLLQARGVRKGQRLREKLEEGEWASAAVRRLTPARRASAHPDMAAECSGRSERLREI